MTVHLFARFLILFATLMPSTRGWSAEKPNILFILADDLGWADLGCYGSDLHRTPHLDHLAQKGLRFTHAYAAAHVCSPTRASILTGKYPARLHMTDWLNGHVKPYAQLSIPEWTKGLPDEENTLAEVLKTAGYATGWFGKWHAGKNAMAHGFDAGNEDWEHNRKESETDPKGVFTVNQEAQSFIKSNASKPFFVALSHYSVHGPVRYQQALKTDYEQQIEAQKTSHQNAGYAAMLEALDTSVGQMLEWLENEGLLQNTLVIFTSDNGGECNFTNNLPLRAGKGTLYEGGVRIPFIVRWDGQIPEDQTSAHVINTIDLLPTFAQLAGASLSHPVDGIDVSTTFTANQKPERTSLFWHYPHYHAEKPSGSILKEDWKLIEWYESGKTELFQLSTDPSEQHDLAAAKPEKRDELLRDLQHWRKEVGAQMPMPNPQHDPSRAHLSAQQIKNQEAKAKENTKKEAEKSKTPLTDEEKAERRKKNAEKRAEREAKKAQGKP